MILSDVLDFPVATVATMLETSTAAVKGLLQGARPSLRTHPLAGAEGAPDPGSPAEAELARRFADAFSADDVDALTALLTDGAWLAMPPAPQEHYGPETVAGQPSGLVVLTLTANRIAAITRLLAPEMPAVLGFASPKDETA